MSKSDKIRRMLTKGYDASVIAKKLKVSRALVYSVKARDSKKAVLPVLATGKVKGVKKERKLKWVDALLPVEALLPPKVDEVNSPPHYTAGGIEALDFIEAKDLNFRLGNAIKYISRAGKKEGVDPILDLEKAAFYLNREIIIRKGA